MTRRLHTCLLAVGALWSLSGCRCGEPLPQATDPVPASYGTLAQSLAAAGEWVTQGEVRGPQVPDDDERGRLFSSQDRLKQGPLRQGLLVCEVAADKKKQWDGALKAMLTLGATQAPDIDVALTIGQEPGLRASAPSNEHVVHVTAPLVTLEQGTKVRVQAWDRDLSELEPMGQAAGAFDGTFPLQFSGEHFAVACVGLAQKPGEWQLTHNVLPFLDHGLRALSDPDSYAGKTPRSMLSKLQELQRWFTEGAAYVGWADPRLLQRRGAYRQAVLKTLRRIEPRGLPARKPAALAFGEITAKVGAVGCRPAGDKEAGPQRDCSIELELTSTSKEALAVLPRSAASAMYDVFLFTNNGQLIPLVGEGFREGKEVIHPRVSRDQPPLRVVLRPPRRIDFTSQTYGGARYLAIRAARNMRPESKRPARIAWIRL